MSVVYDFIINFIINAKSQNLYIKTLERIEDLDKNHDVTLQSILKIDEKVKKILEEKGNII